MNAWKFDKIIVHHPKYSEARDALKKVNTTTALPLTFLLGSNGVGKSTLLADLRNQLLFAAKPGEMPILQISWPGPVRGNSRALAIRVYQQLASAVASDLQTPVTTRRFEDLRKHAERMIRLSSTRVLIIDDADSLPKSNATFELLMGITENLGCNIILTGTTGLHCFMQSLNPQLMNVVPFLRYNGGPVDQGIFLSILKTVSEIVPECAKPFETHATDLFHGCLGSMGLLKTWISRANRSANLRKSREVEWSDFLAARLSQQLLNNVTAQDAMFRVWQKHGSGELEVGLSPIRSKARAQVSGAISKPKS